VHSTPNSVSFEVLDVAGNEVTVEVMFRRDTVELRCAEHLRAIFDREALSLWFRQPEDVLSMDDVVLTLHDGLISIWIAPQRRGGYCRRSSHGVERADLRFR
jgi:hypothetical protein